ncbi:MAG TPA: hypothetical protein ENO22_14000 [candidate division Zixibacteria bacterium]|nr:hypothetical protein [candidate division Zixibacteria bacterium]
MLADKAVVDCGFAAKTLCSVCEQSNNRNCFCQPLNCEKTGFGPEKSKKVSPGWRLKVHNIFSNNMLRETRERGEAEFAGIKKISAGGSNCSVSTRSGQGGFVIGRSLVPSLNTLSGNSTDLRYIVNRYCLCYTNPNLKVVPLESYRPVTGHEF